MCVLALLLSWSIGACQLNPQQQAQADAAKAEMDAARELVEQQVVQIQELSGQVTDLVQEIQEGGLSGDALVQTSATLQAALTQLASAQAAKDEGEEHFEAARTKYTDLEEDVGLPWWVMALAGQLGLDLLWRGLPSKGAGGTLIARASSESATHRARPVRPTSTPTA